MYQTAFVSTSVTSFPVVPTCWRRNPTPSSVIMCRMSLYSLSLPFWTSLKWNKCIQWNKMNPVRLHVGYCTCIALVNVFVMDMPIFPRSRVFKNRWGNSTSTSRGFVTKLCPRVSLQDRFCNPLLFPGPRWWWGSHIHWLVHLNQTYTTASRTKTKSKYKLSSYLCLLLWIQSIGSINMIKTKSRYLIDSTHAVKCHRHSQIVTWPQTPSLIDTVHSLHMMQWHTSLLWVYV